MKRYIIVMLAFLVLLGACEIKEPTLPSWDMLLNVPLINERFYVSDLVDSVNIMVDDNQILTLTGNGEVSTDAFGNLDFDPDTAITNQDIPSGVNTPITLPFVDSTGHLTIAYAEIIGGIFRYRFTNMHPSAVVTLTFQNLFLDNNQPLEVQASANTGWTNINLSGLHIGSPTATSVISGLPVLVQSISDEPLGTPIAELSFDATSTLQFSAFRGYMNGINIGLEESSSQIDIDYPHNVDDSITLHEARLILDIENEVGFGAEFTGRLFASNEDGDTLSVPIRDSNQQNFHVDPADHNGPVITSLEIGEGIEPILEMMPDNIKIINGRFSFNSGSEIGFVQSSHSLDVDYLVEAPFRFDLHANEIVVDSVYTLEISEENRDRILNNALAADLTITILNKLPVGASAKVFFSNSEDIDVYNPSTYLFSKEASLLAAADPNPWQTVSVGMTKEELDVFAQPMVYYSWSFSFQDADDVTIYARTTDYIHVQSMAKVKIRMEDL